MSLTRLYAFSVVQQKGAGEAFEPPSGGKVPIVEEVHSALESALDEAEKADQTRVRLRVRGPERSSQVVDAVRLLAGEDEGSAEQAAAELAGRLNRVMDMRSKAGLFIAAVFRPSAQARQREVVLWVFPRDKAFRFESEKHQIEIVEDVFSQTSRQRKLALFKGTGARGDFIGASVLDFQNRGRTARVAAFWIDDFLEADPDISGPTGSRLVALAFVAASKELIDPAEREQLQAAVIALRHAPERSRSASSIAKESLDGNPQRAFEQALKVVMPSEKARRSHFSFDRNVFAENVNYRFFRLSEGTQVIAPIEEIGKGKTVQIDRPTGVNGGRLRVDDVIVEDKMTRR